MFFISETNNNLTIETLGNKEPSTDCKVIIIEEPKQVTVIGKNSVYDSPIHPYVHKGSLTFFGKTYVHLKDEVPLAIYELRNSDGYVVHEKTSNLVFVSRSFSKIVDYCLKQEFSILGVIRQNKSSDFIIPSITINNDFAKSTLKAEEVNADDHLYFELGWDINEDYMNFNLVINQQGYLVNKNGLFYEEYKGTAPNIGTFRQVILKDLDADQRLPNLFPEATLDRCVVFTKLVDDNALSVLVPNVISIGEYNAMIKEMKTIGRKQLTFNGMHKHGYGVQAFIELLPEEESVTNYEAKVTHLIIAPHDIFVTSQIFK